MRRARNEVAAIPQAYDSKLTTAHLSMPPREDRCQPSHDWNIPKNSARTAQAPTESHAPIFDPMDHPDEDDTLDTKAFVHEIFEAAKHCSGRMESLNASWKTSQISSSANARKLMP